METVAPLYRVCLIGPECTAKTTIAQRLASHYATVWVPEYAREYAERVRRELTSDDVEPIARGQVANEDRVAPEASSLLVLDTDLISTYVYANAYYASAPEWIESEAVRRRADLYLLSAVDIAFERDAARAEDEHRAGHFTAFRDALAHFGASWELLDGVGELRFERAIAAVERARPSL